MRRGSTEVIIGVDGGKYPHGNTVVVHGGDQRVVMDPGLSLWSPDLLDPPPPVAADRVVLTHVHEDHVAGLARYGDVPVAVRAPDAVHLHSLDDLMAMYGVPDDAAPAFAESLVRDFHFLPRPDVEALADDTVLDLGGGITMTAIPTPGHTRGHTAWLIEPDGVLVIGDIDLSSFGPYYADAVSSLEDFVASMATIRGVEAAWYVTFHHKGVVEGHDAFVTALDAFAAVVDRRDDAIVEYCAEPRTIADMAEHRFLYRPHVELPWVASAERRTAEQHVERLVRAGRLVADGDTYLRT